MFRRRYNPLYEPPPSKSHDSGHVLVSTGACSQRCLLVVVLIAVVMATAAVAMAIVAITMLLTGASPANNILHRFCALIA